MLALLAPGGRVRAAESGPLEQTRTALEKWIETWQLIARLKADWQADQETLRGSIQLFTAEQERLDKALAELDTGNVKVAGEQKQNLELQARNQAALDRALALVAGFEKQLLAMARNLPPPVTEKLAKLLSLVPADPATAKAPLLNRVQILVGILKAVDEFNSKIDVLSELRRTADQREVQVRTIYLGLGQAWFVDESSTFAGRGGPAADGWKWEVKNDVAPLVRRVIAIYEQAQPAAFVGLPVELR